MIVTFFGSPFEIPSQHHIRFFFQLNGFGDGDRRFMGETQCCVASGVAWLDWVRGRLLICNSPLFVGVCSHPPPVRRRRRPRNKPWGHT